MPKAADETQSCCKPGPGAVSTTYEEITIESPMPADKTRTPGADDFMDEDILHTWYEAFMRAMQHREVIESFRQELIVSLQSKRRNQVPSKKDSPHRSSSDTEEVVDCDQVTPLDLPRAPLSNNASAERTRASYTSLSSQCSVFAIGCPSMNSSSTDANKSRALQEIDGETMECYDAVQRDVMTFGRNNKAGISRESMFDGTDMAANFQLSDIQPSLPRPRCCACKATLPDSRLARFMLSRPVVNIITCIILANTLFIGYETNVNMSEALTQKNARNVVESVMESNKKPGVAERVINISFTAFFSMELLLKLIALRGYFFTGDGWKWNLFDMFLVCTSIIQESFENSNVGFMRTLRIFRVIRVSRILRVLQIFRSLRVMVLSIGASLMSLAWAFALLLLIMYTFALLLMKGAQAFIEESDRNSDAFQVAQDSFGSVWKTMICLLQIISGGDDWNPIYQILNKQSPFYGIILIAYVVFVVFGVLNVLVGVIVCDSASIQDFDLICHSEVEQRRQFIQDMKAMFQDLDADGSGFIYWDEFDQRMHDQGLQAYFASHELDPFNARLLFKLLDEMKTGKIDIADFTVGCYRLKGQAKSMQVKKIERDLRRYHAEIHDRFQQLEQLLRADSSKIGSTAL